MLKLTNFYVYMTWKCNLHCKHCWVEAGNNKDNIIERGTLLNTCLEAISLGARFIKFSGGEPLLYANDLIWVANEIKTKYPNVHLHLETNATLIDNRLAFDLKVFESISVSLDSSNAKVHNFIRGSESAFEDAISGITSLIAQGNDIRVTSVIYDIQNIDQHVDRMAKLLKELKVKKLKLNPIMRNGRAENLQENMYNITPQDMIQLQARYANKSDPQIRIMLPCAYGWNFRDSHNSIASTCNCLTLMSILPNGNIGLCGEAKNNDKFIFGNIFDMSLTEIWEKSSTLNEMRNMIPDKLEGVCSLCAIKQLCKGGCRVDGYLSGGKINSPSYICQTMYNSNKFHLLKNSNNA